MGRRPNDKIVELKYLDSVKLGIPRLFRTKVYQEILNGLYKYFRKEGFQNLYIYAQPPPSQDDRGYLFYYHPEDQQVPTLDMLIKWYKKGFSRGIYSGCLSSYSDIVTHLRQTNAVCLTHAPYFWLWHVEEYFEEEITLYEVRKIKKELKTFDEKSINAENSAVSEDSIILEGSSVSKNSAVSDEHGDLDTYAQRRLWEHFNTYREQLFVVSLQSDKSMPNEMEADEDAEIENVFFENTDQFIQFQISKKLDFSDETIALRSTTSWFMNYFHFKVCTACEV